MYACAYILLAQTNELQRSTPEAEGVPSEAIITLFDSLTAYHTQTSIVSLCYVMAK